MKSETPASPPAFLHRRLRSALFLALFASAPFHASALELESMGIRARVSGATTLGDPQPEEFHEYDLAANLAFPGKRTFETGWKAGSRLMASMGLLHGTHRNAAVFSLIPEVTLESKDGLLLDAGVGGALFSRHEFERQDYGGLFQFAITMGARVPISGRHALGYRFLHYSDADLYGSGSTGADFHMIELIYRF